MTTDTIDAPPTDPAPARVRPLRVLRGVLVVVTTAALLVAVATLADWAWGPARSTDAWAGRFGDPRIVLAEGVSLPAAPETITRWSLEPTTYGLPDDTSVLEAVFGGPVVAVGDHTWATATGTVDFPQLASVLADPTSWMNGGPEFTGAGLAQVPDAPTFATQDDQLVEVHRILAILGWPADTTVEAADGQLGRIFRVRPTVPEATTSPRSSVFPAPRFVFAEDGTLKSLTLQPWALTQPAELAPVRSAEQALDDLRHHRSEVATTAGGTVPNLVERVLGTTFFPADDSETPPPGPIASVTLYGDSAGVIGQTHPVWVFSDADGNTVGAVLAAEDDVFPPGLR
ncbi:hypothetical protein [Cellulomonas rhizosphaerae]|uniref:Uncharacterized protein n=1 Tax=Cellulomonas rhizosphaerae TaxID=2293719 RepID=A0A413RMB4_9CELL|nr:hypothetical protein [Cellulomonas rhizosphaerae]RHA41950.1 hypothetical protein D1825_08045 [Cellulomonas rhizosphaerae]